MALKPKQIAAGLALTAALSLGGGAIAMAQTTTTPSTTPSTGQSTTTAPSAAPDPGTRAPGDKKDCPNMGGGGGEAPAQSNSSGSSSGSGYGET